MGEVRKKDYFINDYIEIWLENGVINLKYLPGAKITIKEANTIVQERLKISNGISRPLLSDARNIKSADKEARECFASGDGIKYVSAGAIIINNQIQKLLMNALLYINKPLIPAKGFTNKEDAIKWLNYYKNVN